MQGESAFVMVLIPHYVMRQSTDSTWQGETLKAIQELDITVGTSSLIRQKEYASNEHYRRSGLILKSGALMSKVLHCPYPERYHPNTDSV